MEDLSDPYLSCYAVQTLTQSLEQQTTAASWKPAAAAAAASAHAPWSWPQLAIDWQAQQPCAQQPEHPGFMPQHPSSSCSSGPCWSCGSNDGGPSENRPSDYRTSIGNSSGATLPKPGSLSPRARLTATKPVSSAHTPAVGSGVDAAAGLHRTPAVLPCGLGPRSFPMTAVVGLEHIKHALLLGAVDTGAWWEQWVGAFREWGHTLVGEYFV